MTALLMTHPAVAAPQYRTGGWWGPETLWTALSATAAESPDATMIVEGEHRLTFAEVLARAERLSGSLHALGVGRGDPVAFQLPNWWETITLYVALARLGAVANPILPIAGERELRFILRDGGARVLFVPGTIRNTDHPEVARRVRRDVDTLAYVITVRTDATDDMLAWDALPHAPAPPPATDAEAIALLMYTSGTTATPKGVLHSHATLLAEARSLGPAHGLTAADRTLMPSPLTHVSGLVHAVLVPVALGTSVVLMPRWDPDDAHALIAHERVTYMVGAPTFLHDLAERVGDGTSSLRLFSCGGADVDPALVRRAAARLGCVAKRVYGSTEFPTVSTTLPEEPLARGVDSEGRPIGPVEILLVDEQDHPVATGSEGEILARGPECFLGYHDATLNAEAFTSDGWFRTGDLGTLDADGWLRITGRRKDVIIRKGENISAREVEELVATHPAVAEVAVIGLPDPAAGEIACAVLRVRAGSDVPTVESLGEHLLAAGLSKRRLPERVEVVETLPRTDSGKVLKRALRDRFALRR